ncbi:succinate dehydrogenase, cytochrome b556 subunit, partial [endosymbiont of Ridgeia piscesae]
MVDNNKRPVFLNLLQIHMPITAVVSILHRLTGVLMFLSIPLLVKLLSLSVSGEEDFAQALELFRHPFSQLLLYLLLWVLLHHLLAGIRFLLIDMEIGVARQQARASARLVLISGLFAALLLG